MYRCRSPRRTARIRGSQLQDQRHPAEAAPWPGMKDEGLLHPTCGRVRWADQQKHGRPRPMRGSSDRGLDRVATSRRAPSALYTSCARRYGVGQEQVCRKLKKCPTWGSAGRGVESQLSCVRWVIGRRSRWRDPVSSHQGGPGGVALTLMGSGSRTRAPRGGPAPPPGPLEGRHRANRDRPPPCVCL